MIDSFPAGLAETPECYQLTQIIATSPGTFAVTQAQIWREKALELERRLIAMSAETAAAAAEPPGAGVELVISQGSPATRFECRDYVAGAANSHDARHQGPS